MPASCSTTDAASPSCSRMRRWRSPPSSRRHATGEPARDTGWTGRLRAEHEKRTAAGKAKAHDTGPDGYVHPMAIFDAIRAQAKPDAIAIADGGDLLSFARVGLEAKTYMDAGAFGCLGVGVPYAIGRLARLSRPAGVLRHRRWRLRLQRDGDRHGGAPRREDRPSSSPTTPPGTSSATTRRRTTAAASSVRRSPTRTMR